MSGPWARARLPGRVHGVVVQITIAVPSSLPPFDFSTGKRTWIVSEV
jgi:hypothetical protein